MPEVAIQPRTSSTRPRDLPAPPVVHSAKKRLQPASKANKSILLFVRVSVANLDLV